MEDKVLKDKFESIANCVDALTKLYKLLDEEIRSLREDVDKLIENQKGGIK